MANHNRTALGENRAGKSKFTSASYLDLFIGSADFESICRTMRISDQTPKEKDRKK